MDSLHEKNVCLEDVIEIMCECLKSGQTVSFSPHGTSMLPMLRQGKDCVTLAALPEKLKKYDIPLYKRENGQYVLHRIVAVGETYTCVGDNQFEVECGVKKEQMIAIVSEFSRNGKSHSVQEISYQLYCRGWHYSRILRGLWRKGKHFLKRR